LSEAIFATLQPGAVFHDRYRIVRCIKAGGMGAVYEIVDTKTDSHRALKVMLPGMVDEPELRARFELEARVTGNVESDHIVRVSDAGIDDSTETPFLVMDLLRGQELGGILKVRRPLPAPEVLLYLQQTAVALDKTHAAGIVHRDLKPENLFITYRDDGSPCVKILDFGIAKVLIQSDQTRGTQTLGTPLYMPPEQIRGDGQVGHRVDLYALGHIAYTLLAGEPYWNEERRASEAIFSLLSRIAVGAQEKPTERAQRRRSVVLPPAFDDWFFEATAVDPEARFEDARAQIAALAQALGLALPRSSLTQIQIDPTSSGPSEPRLSIGFVPMTSSPSLGSQHLSAPSMMTSAPARPGVLGRGGLSIALGAAVAGGLLALVLALVLWAPRSKSTGSDASPELSVSAPQTSALPGTVVEPAPPSVVPGSAAASFSPAASASAGPRSSASAKVAPGPLKTRKYEGIY
jgi:serine/threonine-protein kinase